MSAVSPGNGVPPGVSRKAVNKDGVKWAMDVILKVARQFPGLAISSKFLAGQVRRSYTTGLKFPLPDGPRIGNAIRHAILWSAFHPNEYLGRLKRIPGQQTLLVFVPFAPKARLIKEKTLFRRGVTQAVPKSVPVPPPDDAPLFQEEFLTVGEFRVFAKALVGTLEDVVEMVKRTALGKVV